MAKRKLKRIKEIEALVAELNFKDKGFKQALRFECKQEEVSFNRLRHYTDSNGVEVYVQTWNNYRDKLYEEGITSKLLVQAYHHVFQNLFNAKIFTYVVEYLRRKNL